MFSLQQSDELVSHEIPSSISFQQLESNQQDLIVGLHDLVTMDVTCNINTNLPARKARKRHGDQSSSKTTSATADWVRDGKDDHTQKKMVHREIERRRRQDMTKLYASLRGLLPLEFIKGKRSVTDHMQQAVNYIKQMHENIEVLSVKRDQLKKFVDIVPSGLGNTDESLMDILQNKVSISSCINGGVEILINSCSVEDGTLFPLLGVLKALSQEGLNVTSCTSTKVNGRLLHSIQSEVIDPTWTNLSLLQRRLTAIANNLPNSN